MAAGLKTIIALSFVRLVVEMGKPKSTDLATRC